MTATTSSIQPRTFAQVDAQYSSISARCICGDTIRRTTDGEYRHHSGDVWCRPRND
jgi:hypothetical protein